MDSCLYSPDTVSVWDSHTLTMGGQLRDQEDAKEDTEGPLPWNMSPTLSDTSTRQFTFQHEDSLPDLESVHMGHAVQEETSSEEAKSIQCYQYGYQNERTTADGGDHQFVHPGNNTATPQQEDTATRGYGPSVLAGQTTIDATFIGLLSDTLSAPTNGGHFSLGHSSITSSTSALPSIKSLPMPGLKESIYVESQPSIACTQPSDRGPGTELGPFVNPNKVLHQSLPADLATLPMTDLVHGDLNITDYIPSSQNSVPSSQNSVPSSQNQVPSSQNSVPFSQNQVPSSQNSVPFSQNSVPSSQNLVPSSQNSVASSENLIVDVTESSKNPNTVCFLYNDRLGHKVHAQDGSQVYRPSPTQTDRLQYVPAVSGFEAEPFQCIVKQEPEEEGPKPQRRRKRKGGLTDGELQQEIEQKKAKEAKQVQLFDPIAIKKKENRKRQNREAAERCRIKKKKEEERQKKEADVILEDNMNKEREIEELLAEKAQLTAILQNHQCSSVPAHILTSWREQCHTNNTHVG